ncbi:hypothetical protein WA556_001603, partial [Blastocystis sp. ATCC 50177/Nand II]
MKRCYLFLLLFSLSVCLVVKAPEHYVVSHVMANSGISIMCKYSGELVRMNTSDSSAAVSKASFVDLTKGESSVEEAVLSAQSLGSAIAVIVVNATTDMALKGFDSTYRNATAANQIHICGILISREAGEHVSSLLRESAVFIEVSSRGELESSTIVLAKTVMTLFILILLVSYCFLRVYFSNRMIHKRTQEKLNRRVALIPCSRYHTSQPYPPCSICFEEFKENDPVSILPCNHCFHYKCITPWLGNKSVCCPVCKKCPYRGVDVEIGGADRVKEIERETQLKRRVTIPCGQYVLVFVLVYVIV